MRSEHFKDAELACPCCGVNGVKPAVLDAAEAIRAKAEARYGLGRVRMGVQSGYRCENHNKAIGGATNSQHMQGTALDLNLQIAKDSGGEGKLAWVTVRSADWEDLARQAPLLGGIGRDDERHFIHIDTRDKTAQWCYESYAHPHNSTKFYRECAYYPDREAR